MRFIGMNSLKRRRTAPNKLLQQTLVVPGPLNASLWQF